VANQRPNGSFSMSPWLLVVVLAYLMVGCTSDDFASELPSTVAPPQATTLEGLQNALEASVEKLSEAVGIEVIEQDYLDGELSRSIWAKSWPNGDYVSIENTDLSVAEGGSSDIVASRARLQIGDMLYTAGTGTDGVDNPWRVDELTEAPLQEGQHFLPISVPLQAMEEGFFLLDLDEVPADSVTVQRSDTTHNGVLWSLEVSWSGEARTIQHWEVDESGHLASFSIRADGLPTPDEMTASPRFPNTPTAPVDASRQREIAIEFKPLEDPEQLTAPPIGEPLDLQALEIPDGLPLTD
jgi:hypothetical protein